MHYKVLVFSHTVEQAEQFMRKYTAVNSTDFDSFDPAYCEWEVADEEDIREMEKQIAFEKSDAYTFERHAEDMEQYRKDFDDFDEFVKMQYEFLKSDENTLEAAMWDMYQLRWCDKIQAYARMFNPNEKCDWYYFGGRFADRLRLKPGRSGEDGERPDYLNIVKKPGFCDRAKLRDISWEADAEREQFARRAWEVKIEGDSLRDSDDAIGIRYSEPEKFSSKEAYIDFYSRTSAEEYIDPDGEWHRVEPFCLWVRNSDGTYRLCDEISTLLEKYPDLLISVYDIHD